jgi:hypothetical protein
VHTACRRIQNLVSVILTTALLCALRYAHGKGVIVGRREATPKERLESGDKRKGKLYVVWAKLEVPPKDAVSHQSKKEEASQAEAAKRKERELKRKQEQERIELKRKQEQERKEKIKRQKVITAYEKIVQEEDSSKPKPNTVSSGNAIRPNTVSSSSNVARLPPPSDLSETVTAEPVEEGSNNVPDPTPQDLLQYSDEVYQQKLKQIRVNIAQERKEMEEQLDKKKKSLEKQAFQETQAIKASILQKMPSDKECQKCHKQRKLLVAECTACQARWCADCLTKVSYENKCYLCQEAWLGKKQKATIDDASIRTDGNKALAKFYCKQCDSKSKFGDSSGLEYARCCDQFVCDDHTLHHNCCVCSGSRTLCKSCGVEHCGRCGRELCNACSIKEGCMCEDVSYRRDRFDY